MSRSQGDEVVNVNRQTPLPGNCALKKAFRGVCLIHIYPMQKEHLNVSFPAVVSEKFRLVERRNMSSLLNSEVGRQSLLFLFLSQTPEL